VQLCFVEDREKVATAKKNQRRDVVERVEETDGGRNQNERHHERSPRFVHITEQAIQRDAETNKDYVADEIAEDRQSKHRFVRENIVGRRGGVAVHDQLARNVKQTERRGEYHREINRAGDACGFLGWMHASFSFLFLEIR